MPTPNDITRALFLVLIVALALLIVVFGAVFQ